MSSPKSLAARDIWALALMVAVPAILIAVKLAPALGGEFLGAHLSLLGLPHRTQARLVHILFVPLGAMLVVFARLTLGIRVLGPFRSTLLGFAFQVTGVALGLAFLAVMVGVIALTRVRVKGLGLPYFGRISVMLSVVAVLVVLAALVGTWLDLDALRRVAYFPLVVLCLIGDAFVRTVSQEGMRSAVWRGCATALVAVGLSRLASLPALQHALLAFPELLCVQTAATVVLSKWCAWRLLEWLNPKVGRDEDEDKEGEDAPAPSRGPCAGRVPSPAVAHAAGARTAPRELLP